jgi:hypothetical protein
MFKPIYFLLMDTPKPDSTTEKSRPFYPGIHSKTNSQLIIYIER